jgi:hypothetical protein
MAGHSYSNVAYYFILACNMLITLEHTIIIVLRSEEWMRIGC